MEFMSSQPIHLLRKHWQLIRVERSVKKSTISINTLVTFDICSCFYVRNVHVCRHVALKVCLSPVTMCMKSLQVTGEENKENEPLSSPATPKPG